MNQKKHSMKFTIIILAVVAVCFIVMNLIGIKAEPLESAVKISAPMFSQTVSYQDIADVQLRSDINYGTRTFGSDMIGIKTGTFRNTEFGEYQCAVYASVSECIVIQKASGDIIVFNSSTKEQTTEVFSTLQQKLSGNES